MGWWWSSGSTNSSSTSSHTSQASSNNQPFSPTSENSYEPKQPAPKHQLSREEQADKDLEDLLSELYDDSHISRPIQSPLRFLLGSKPDPTPSAAAPTKEEEASNLKPNDAGDLESANLPTTLSCRDCFDYAFFCQSFGGQFVNVYRYGKLRNCKEHWSDFWFCMRTKSYSDDERKQRIQDRWRRKEMKFKTGPSSEDVWLGRKQKVEGAFLGDWNDIYQAEKEREEALEKELASRTRGSQGTGTILAAEKLENVVDGAKS